MSYWLFSHINQALRVALTAITTLFNQAQLFQRWKIYRWYLYFSGGKTRRWHGTIAAFYFLQTVFKFHFNISDIFAMLMINFFVCRVDSLSFSSWLPTPTHINTLNKIYILAICWAQISGNFYSAFLPKPPASACNATFHFYALEKN